MTKKKCLLYVLCKLETMIKYELYLFHNKSRLSYYYLIIAMCIMHTFQYAYFAVWYWHYISIFNYIDLGKQLLKPINDESKS